jgi:2-hydroxychromene-2-carboxylate isomerase
MAGARVSWYFDFISPFAWLQAERLQHLRGRLELDCRPVLFAGLLEHWGQLGPAEIAPKRVYTYRYVVWRAAALGLSVRLPAAHPFNPLPLLRLAVALDCDFTHILRLFRFVWSEGRVPDDAPAWRALVEELEMPDADARIAQPEVKAQLRRNGEEAVARGVFGVPTAVVGDALFWGEDSTDMLLDYLAGDALFASPQMDRAGQLPIGQARRA